VMIQVLIRYGINSSDLFCPSRFQCALIANEGESLLPPGYLQTVRDLMLAGF
jgi:hypothetical protein